MYPHIIPEVYELTTNDGTFLVNAHPTTKQMADYITRKFKSGVPINGLIFKVRPIKVPTPADIINKL